MRDVAGGNTPGVHQSKSHRSAVVLIPESTVWGPIQQIRRSHDRHVRRWMPHVTLMYPFLEGIPRETALERLSTACQSLAPFDVSLNRLERFRHRSSNTIWLKPEPTEALRRLHDSVWSACPECDEVRKHSDGFTPHLSIGQVKGEAACLSLLETLQNSWSPITFRADRISVIARKDPPDDVFRSLWEIGLGHGEVVEVDG